MFTLVKDNVEREVATESAKASLIQKGFKEITKPKASRKKAAKGAEENTQEVEKNAEA